MNAARLSISLLALGLIGGCKVTIPKYKGAARGAAATSSAGESAAPPTATSAPAAAATAKPLSALPQDEQLFRVPVGPTLTILPGEGLGPIRFGANLKTIQRLMEADCTELSEHDGKQWCRYQPNAVDFGLDDKGLVEIHVHGMEREFVPGKGLGVDNIYGIFRGSFVNKAQLGMYPQYASQGEPLRVEKVEPGRFPTVEKHYHENMVLEYDKLKNGNVVLGGVVLTKPTKPFVPPKEKGAAKVTKKKRAKPVH